MANSGRNLGQLVSDARHGEDREHVRRPGQVQGNGFQFGDAEEYAVSLVAHLPLPRLVAPE